VRLSHHRTQHKFEPSESARLIDVKKVVPSQESSMQFADSQARRKFATRQVEVDELKHLIHKLRWMGLDQEAETACARLSRLSPAATVLAVPRDTD
jgi:hypothetical protein